MRQTQLEATGPMREESMSALSQATQLRLPARNSRWTNVGAIERVCSAVAGIWLLRAVPRRTGKWGALTALMGTGLLHRGWTGKCYVYQTLGIDGVHDYSAAAGVRAKHGV